MPKSRATPRAIPTMAPTARWVVLVVEEAAVWFEAETMDIVVFENRVPFRPNNTPAAGFCWHPAESAVRTGEYSVSDMYAY